MRTKIRLLVFTVLLLTISHFVYAQDNITVVTPSTAVAEGLDLYAVAELFKDCKNLEEFERALNDPQLGINNLDLDLDGYVDYIRVVEQVNDYTHIIILQVPLGYDEYQDVATIEIERSGYNNYNMQVHGNEVIYGVDYYVVPVYVHIHHWPIITWLYRPFYRPYWSVFYFGYYPGWWRPYRPVTVHVYHRHTARYSRRATFHVTRVSRVTTVHKVNYKPRTSHRVEQMVNNRHPRPGNGRFNRTITPRPDRGKTTLNQDFNKKYHNKSKRSTHNEVTRYDRPAKKWDKPIHREVRKKTKPDRGKNITINRELKRTTRPDARKNRNVNRGIKKPTPPKTKKSPVVKREIRKPAKPPVKITKPSPNRLKKSTPTKAKKKTTTRAGNKKPPRSKR